MGLYARCKEWPIPSRKGPKGGQVSSGPHTLKPEELVKFEVCKKLLVEEVQKLRGPQEGEPYLPDTMALSDEDLLLRFFIARGSKPEVAVQAALESIKWRKDNGIDEVFEWSEKNIPRDFLFKSHSDGLCGFYGIDSEGYPIWWERPNQKGLTALIEKYQMDDLLMWHYCMVERGRELSGLLRVDRITIVLDLKDVSGSGVMFGKTGSLLKAQSKQDQIVYPECMRKLFIINAPWGFSGVWSLIKVLLDKRVQEKIVFSGKRGPDDALAKYVTPENVPKEFGGQGETDWSLCRPMPTGERNIFRAPMYIEILKKYGEIQEGDAEAAAPPQDSSPAASTEPAVACPVSGHKSSRRHSIGHHHDDHHTDAVFTCLTHSDTESEDDSVGMPRENGTSEPVGDSASAAAAGGGDSPDGAAVKRAPSLLTHHQEHQPPEGTQCCACLVM